MTPHSVPAKLNQLQMNDLFDTNANSRLPGGRQQRPILVLNRDRPQRAAVGRFLNDLALSYEMFLGFITDSDASLQDEEYVRANCFARIGNGAAIDDDDPRDPAVGKHGTTLRLGV